jgi:carboxyl-terminal processing protease
MIKKIKERKLHLLIITFLIGLFLGINIANYSAATEGAHKYLDYFHQVYQIILTDYVDTVDNKNIFYGAIRGMVKALDDPFSRFLDESAYSSLMEETSGKFVGIGVEITVKNNEIVVISPIEDTPAMKAGVLAGDVITKINDKPVSDKDLGDIIKEIRGVPSTRVKLTIKRSGFDDPLDFDIERAAIKINTVSYSILNEFNDTGYMKVKLFSSDTAKDVEEALKYFNGKGIQKLIVDLRWNPGGLLDKAINAIDLFLLKGQMIVSTRGREGSGNVSEFKATGNPLYAGKLIVLVNNGSASASEIFSGAIRDNKRGKLLGEKTFGKGSVQKFYSLDDNIGATITIAKYYTPSGASIHGKGIEPDYKVEMEKFSPEDKVQIEIIVKKKILENFVLMNKIYNDENRRKFNQQLKDNNIAITEKTADYLLKREMYRYSKPPLYELEFDNQLNEAIRIISEKDY